MRMMDDHQYVTYNVYIVAYSCAASGLDGSTRQRSHYSPAASTSTRCHR